MSKQYPGGIISKTPPVPTQSAASGVWTLDQQAYWQKLGQWPAPPNLISRSLRFNSADSAWLSRTPASASNRKTWTYSTWVKRVNTGATQHLLRTNATPITLFRFESADQLYFYSVGVSAEFRTTAVYRDFSAWYHVVLSVDTTQATSSDRLKLYVNGVQVTAFSTATYPTQNTDLGINTASLHGIGAAPTVPDEFSNQYLTEVNFIDGQALTPSSFGYTDANTGVWTTLRYNGTYGTNGFYLNFSDNSNTTAATLGADYSGNGNNWTPNNFSVTAGSGNDSVVDSPTPYGTDTGVGGEVRGNYGTLNPIGLGGGTLSNGNLDFSATATTTPAVGTFALTTGKWYWEVRCNSVSAPRIGVYDVGSANPTDLGGTAFGWCLLSSPSRTFTNGSTTSYGAFSPTAGTIVMVAYDADAGKLWFGQDGTWFASGVPSTGTSPSMSSVTGKAIVPAIGNGNVGTDTFSINLGQRAFSYTAPSGFKALCTQNLPTPTIGATTATTADKYFAPTLYTGNGTSQTITTGFMPNLVWIKSRSNAQSHFLHNNVDNVSLYLSSNNTSAEGYDTTSVTAISSTGFSLGTESNHNGNGNTYVAWGWNASGSSGGTTNTAGSITSTVSANTTAGFSVVTYTGNGTNGATVGHGLGVTPSMVILKSRSGGTYDWRVYHSGLTAGYNIALNSTAAQYQGSSGNAGYISAVASTTYTLTQSGANVLDAVNASGGTYVAYCFAPIAGYSAFGSYTGNGSADGPFVFTGFRPAFVLVKNSSTTGKWVLMDTSRGLYNVMSGTNALYPNLSDAEGTDSANREMDFLSSGFKLRCTGGDANGSGNTIIYMAFASNPFKYSLAR